MEKWKKEKERNKQVMTANVEAFELSGNMGL